MKDIHHLVAAHPLLFHGRSPAIASDLPEGWFDIVDALCRSISAALDPASADTFKVWQIKEKFGALRFYSSFVDADGAQSAGEGRQTVGRPVLIKTVRALVLEAERQSSVTCARCGEAGTRREFGGWVVTLCDRHADARGSHE